MRRTIETRLFSNEGPPDLHLRNLLWIVAAWAFGAAIQGGNGHLTPTAFPYFVLAVVLTFAAMGAPRWAALERHGERLCVAVLVGVLVHQFASMTATLPGTFLRISSSAVYLEFFGRLMVCGVLAGASVMAARSWAGAWLFGALVIAHFVLGAWMVRVTPSPHIDVWAWHEQAFTYLRNGMNPYSGTMPEIYGNTAFYAPGSVVNGRVMTGFPYTPLTLGLSFLGKYFGGDYRYAHLAALSATGALLGFARRSALSFGAAAVFMFTPRGLFFLEQGWTDAYPALFAAAVLFVTVRWPARSPWAVGVWIAVKQYVFLVGPLLPLLWRPRSVRELLRPLAVAAVIAVALVLPFALFDLQGFWNSVVALQIRQPFRADSLSFPAWWLQQSGGDPVAWVGFALLLPVYALAWWRAPRTPSGFIGSAALLYCCFFAFGKQAFANYYVFIIILLSAAVALSSPAEPPAQAPSTSLVTT